MDFADKLAALTSAEATAASRDPENYADRMGVMIERLAAALGFTVAIACHGDGPAMDEMLTGAEGYAHREAVEQAPLGRFMAEMRRASK